MKVSNLNQFKGKNVNVRFLDYETNFLMWDTGKVVDVNENHITLGQEKRIVNIDHAQIKKIEVCED